jgi:hypothetical protein
VSVDEEWVYGFGSDRLTTGDERWRVVFIPFADPTDPPRDGQVGVVSGMNGPEAIVVEKRARG